jgi:hypothetical protein
VCDKIDAYSVIDSADMEKRESPILRRMGLSVYFWCFYIRLEKMDDKLFMIKDGMR